MLNPKFQIPNPNLQCFKPIYPWLFIIIISIFICSCSTFLKTHFMDFVDMAEIKDGTYQGSDYNPMSGVKLEVTIKDKKITEIKILNRFATYPLGFWAFNEILKRIIEKQTLDVDAVATATISSNNVKKAVLIALKEAVKRR